MNQTLSPQKLAQSAKEVYQRGDYSEAARLFQAAAEGFKIGGDSLNAAEQANNSSVAFLKSGEAQAALEAVEGTPEVFLAASDLRRQGMALGNKAAALDALNRLDEAEDLYDQAANLLHQVGDEQNRLHLMHSLSALQLRRGKQLQALTTMQAGLHDIKRPSPRQRFLKKLLQIPFRLLNKS